MDHLWLVEISLALFIYWFFFLKKKEKEKKNETWLRVFDLHGEVMIFSFVYDNHGLWDV